MKKFLVSIILVISLLVGTIPSFAETVPYGEELKSVPTDTPTITFSDVDNTHWAAKFITEMVNKKILSGYPDGKFRPDKVITRAEFAKIIVSASGLEPKKVSTSTFSDIKTTDWFSPFVEAAKDYLTGYKIGSGYVYKPNDPALREDICIAIVKLLGYDSKLADLSIIQAMFTDYDSISESAKDFVSIAVENKLVSGFPDETFRAQKSLTRAESCTILWKAFMYGNNNKVVAPVVTTTPTPTPVMTVPTAPTATLVPTVEPTTSTDDNKSGRMTVESLFGGNGFGIVDGSGSKVGYVWSLAIDKNNNVYTLENTEEFRNIGSFGDIDYTGQKVRKYSTATGLVNTILSTKDLTATILTHIPAKPYDSRSVARDSNIDYSGYSGYKLIYDSFTDKMFLSGNYKTSSSISSLPDHRGVMYQIDSTPTEAVTDISFSNNLCWVNDTSLVLNDGSIIYGNEDNLWRVKPQGTVSQYATNNVRHSTLSEGVMSQGKLYLMSVSIDRTGMYKGASLKNYNLGTKKWNVIQEYDESYDYVTSYKNEFFVTSHNIIYKISLDGKKTQYLDSADLILNDFLPVNIDKFMFDSEGNVIFYDSVNSSVRRINLN